MAIDVEEATGKGGVPGASIVDLIPILRHLPSFVERISTTFQPLAHARCTKPSIQHLHDALWEVTETFVRSGAAT